MKTLDERVGINSFESNHWMNYIVMRRNMKKANGDMFCLILQEKTSLASGDYFRVTDRRWLVNRLIRGQFLTSSTSSINKNLFLSMNLIYSLWRVQTTTNTNTNTFKRPNGKTKESKCLTRQIAVCELSPWGLVELWGPSSLNSALMAFPVPSLSAFQKVEEYNISASGVQY